MSPNQSSPTRKFAEVAVNAPTGRTFTYSIPFDLPLAPGQAVWVPFGPRLLQGIVFEVTDQPAVLETRDIAGVIDPTPVLSLAQVEFAGWISRRYLSSPFEAASLMLPPGFERRTLTFLSLKPGAKEPSTMTPQQKELLLLLQREGRVELREIKKSLGARRAETLVGQMVRLRLVSRSQEMEKSRVGPKVVPYLRLAVTPEQAREAATLLKSHRAQRQAALLELLAAGPAGGVPLAEARRQAPFLKATLERLKAQGLILIEEARETRDPMAGRFYRPSTPLTLTPAQQGALDKIEAALNHPQGQPHAFLLHGVTASGKTELYLRAVERTMALGKRAIVLVPEIALTPQTIQRFSSRFPGQVAVLHSRLSLGEQFDEWQRTSAILRECRFALAPGGD
ncbi:MAG: DEAD/DEAH box helicase family protein, partial [Chloroflexota bacterium]|nr:DEAD/DEAH box helicase family protein [Chloroflexota bacterium]